MKKSNRNWSTCFSKSWPEKRSDSPTGGSATPRCPPCVSSHGCRHAYDQGRYESITGFKAPCKFETKAEFRKNAEEIAGKEWRKLNQDACQIIKAELGHGPDRDDVVSQYLGAA